MKRKNYNRNKKNLLPALTKRILPVALTAAIIAASFSTRNVSAAPESWYLNDYEFFQSQTPEEANEAYQSIRRTELSEEITPEESMLSAANYLRRLCGLPALTSLSVQKDGKIISDANPSLSLSNKDELLSGPERKGYTPVGSVFRMPGEGYTPGKWLNYDRLGRDFLSYRTGEALFLFEEDPNGLTIASYQIPDPNADWETETEAESDTEIESSTDEESGTEIESSTDAQSGTEVESGTETEFDTETETKSDTEVESETEETSETEEESETPAEEEPMLPLPFYPYPSAGYFPANLIAANTTAWSVELNSDFIADPDNSTKNDLLITIRDMVTGDTFTRSAAEDTLEIHTTLTGSKVLVFAPPETSIFDGNFGDQAGFRVTVKGLSDADGAPIRSIEWQTIFFTPKSEEKLHLLSVEPEQNQVSFTQGSIAPENLKLFSDFLPINALCTSKESAFLVPLGSWEADAEDFTWRTHPNLAAFLESPIYENLDNPNMLKQRISLPFTFSEELPHLSVTTTRIARGEDFYFILSPVSKEANYSLYQIRESDGKAALSLRATRKYPVDDLITFSMPKMEHDHYGIYFAVISEKDRLTFSNFIFLNTEDQTVKEVTLPEGLIAMNLAKESDFKSDAFDDLLPSRSEPNSEEETEESKFFGREEPTEGKEVRPHQKDDLPLFESIYQNTTAWMSHHKNILFIAAGVLVFLTVVMTMLQMREQRTYRNPSAIKIKKKKKENVTKEPAKDKEKQEDDDHSMTVEDL